jgi:TPR repeat protein
MLVISSCSTPKAPKDFEALAASDPCAASWNLRYERLVGDSCYRKRLTRAAKAGCKADAGGREAVACKVARMLERTGSASRSMPDAANIEQALLAGCDAGDGDGCALLGRRRLEDGNDGPEARDLFERGCEQGSAASCFELASVQDQRPSEEEPMACAEDDAPCHQTACRLGQANACTRLGALLEQQDAQALGRAFGSYERACAMGDWVGCGELGRFYEQGLVVPRDYAIARTLYEWACAPTNPTACVAAGRMFAEGLGGSSDETVAKTMFSSACDSGGAVGCRNAADLVVHAQEDRARRLFSMACDLDDGQSCVRLALLHLDAHQTGQRREDHGGGEQIAELFHRACDAGDKDGCKQGADRFGSGDGVSKDERISAELAAKACHLGSASDCWNAANAYRFGYGVDIDRGLARTLVASAIEGYQQACHADSRVSACTNAAHAIAHGYPQKKRLEEARAFLRKACEDGVEDACREIAFQQVTGEIFEADRASGIASMTKFCDEGDNVVCGRLADELTLGAQNQAELSRAFGLYYRGCYWHSESLACAAHGRQSMRGADDKKSFQKAYIHASRACTDDDAVGCPVATQARLRRGPQEGKDDTSDEDLAEKLENLCIKEGHDVACIPLARLFETGLGAKRDPFRALSLYERVCDADASYSPEACSRARLVRLSQTLADDQESSGTKREWGTKRKKAVQKACKAGDAAQCVLIARHHEFGSFDSGRFEDAVAMYRRACELGTADACTVYIATAYEEGTLWGPAFRKELEWACEQGTAGMCGNWGHVMSSHRWGLAIRLKQRACQKGMDDACRFLERNLEPRGATTSD